MFTRSLLIALRSKHSLSFGVLPGPSAITEVGPSPAILVSAIRSIDWPGPFVRDYSAKPDSKSTEAKGGQGSDDASTSGRSSEEEREGSSSDAKAAAAAAAESARRKGQEAVDQVTGAMRSAGTFVSGVAEELFKKSPPRSSDQGAGGASSSGAGGGSSGTDGGAGDASAGPQGATGEQEQGRARKAAGEAYGRARDAFKSGAPSSMKSFLDSMRMEVAAAVLPATNLPSVMRKIPIDDAVDLRPGEGPAQLMALEQQQTYWDKVNEYLSKSPFYKPIQSLRSSLGGSAAAKKVQEFSADVRERIETADSDVVNRMVDMKANMLAENEAAITYREIKSRNPGFDMPTFLRSVRSDIPIIIKAYLEGQEDVLKEYCSDSMVERLMGIFSAGMAHGQIHDPTILEYSDVDLVDMKMVDGSAVLVLHFNCQQINCYRDQYGNVVSGAPDEVNRMFYYWAVQQDGHGVVTREGKHIPPRWVLTEMMLRGMHQLL